MAWLGTWAYRRKITIVSGEVGVTLVNFPVLLKISPSSGKTKIDVTDIFDEVGANALKIAITTSDGTTQCYVEVEGWDTINEKGVLHFKAPSLAPGSNNEFYIYYDNAQPNNTTYVGIVSSTPGENVWDSNFVGVWHLSEPAGNYLDSTNNNNDSSATDLTSRTASGAISVNSPRLDRSNTDVGITIPDSVSLRLADKTLEAFLKFESFEAAIFPDIIYHRDTVTTAAWYGLELTNAPYEIRNRWQSAGLNAGYLDFAFNVEIVSGGWNYIAGTADTASQTASGFFDAFNPSASTGITNPVSGGSAPTVFGGDSGGFYQDATLDEIRISNIARPASWINATRKTLNDDLLSLSGSRELSSSSSASSSSTSSSSTSSSSESNSSSSISRTQFVEEKQWVLDNYCSDEQWVIDEYCTDDQWLPSYSSSSSSVSSSSSSSSTSSSSSSESCEIKSVLWQKLISHLYLGYEEVHLYIQWRDCTNKVVSFSTSGSAVRDVKLEWDNGYGNTGSYMMSASDVLFVDDGLLVIPSAGTPLADFDYQIQYYDTTPFSFRVTENPERRATEGDVGTENRIIE